MNIHFDDSNIKEALYPFASTRKAADIRVGILTIREKWYSIIAKLGYAKELGNISINAAIIPTEGTATAILKNEVTGILPYDDDVKRLQSPRDIFQLNDWAIRKDFSLLTAGRKSQPIPSSNKLIHPENIFIEEGATVEYAIINASTGPVYIGKNASIMEGSMIRGPFALCERGIVKMGTKIYGATTIGPYCVAGGEIKNSVLFGYSNKAHDGYLGDSVIGEWCNLGAGTSNSNVKNTAGEIRVWNNQQKEYVNAGLKCGLLMGDYSRAAINTSFNTGSVVGICCNIFGENIPPKFTADFTWGKERYLFEKALQDIDNWKKLKGLEITQQEKEQLQKIYNQ